MTSETVYPNRMLARLARACPWPTGFVPLALTLYTGYRLRDFLREGLPIFFDAHSHLTQSWLAARSLAAGPGTSATPLSGPVREPTCWFQEGNKGLTGVQRHPSLAVI